MHGHELNFRTGHIDAITSGLVPGPFRKCSGAQENYYITMSDSCSLCRNRGSCLIRFKTTTCHLESFEWLIYSRQKVKNESLEGIFKVFTRRIERTVTNPGEAVLIH